MPESLFVTEAEMLRRLGFSPSLWKKSERDLERRCFPRPDPLTGLRYWPAVKAFFDRQFNLNSGYEPGGQAYEIPENLEALKRQRGAPRRSARA